MALTEENTIDSIEVLENGQMQVRLVNRIYRDGLFLSQSYHRYVLSPGDDLSGQDERVTAIALVVHTPAVIAAFRLSNANDL